MKNEQMKNCNEEIVIEVENGEEQVAEEQVAEEQVAEERRYWNVFDEIAGHDEDFVPAVTPEFCRTDAPAGSTAKVEVLAERVRKGLPLWHPEDRCSYEGWASFVSHYRN